MAFQDPAVAPAAPAVNITEDKLLVSIWRQPTATLRYVLAHCPDKYVTVLLMLGGIARSIDRASRQNSGDHLSTFSILAMAVVLGGLVGWVFYHIYGWGMKVTGQWLGGRASAEEFRTVLAWALIPTVVSLVLTVPQAIIFGDDLFRSEPQDTSDFAENARLLFGIIEVILAGWSLVILVCGVKLLQGFRTGRALSNILLPALVVVGVIILLVGISKLL